MSFFSEAGLAASRYHENEKMRLCQKCGLSLTYDEEKRAYVCPKGHGEWKDGVVSAQVFHHNESTCGFGGHASGKSSSTGRKYGKKKKVNKQLVGDRYLLD